ncbi:MAG: glycosyltransferase family 4 protein [Candidatus Marinimicrobia bacterium]|nr:glycosyltransferase family 4 protein [Candidatus Neomarinimicrobiota bacterium]
MKILIISQYHLPEMGAAAIRWSDYARILSDKGHQVTVICEIPNYPNGVIPMEYRKKRYVIEKNTTNSYTIIRVPVWANSRKTTFQRLGFYLSFMIVASSVAIRLPRFDFAIVSTPPLFVGIVGIFLQKSKRTPIIIDLRDLWPESAIVLGELKSRILVSFGRWLEKKVYKIANRFFLAVPGFRGYLRNNFSFMCDKPTHDLLNGVSEEFIRCVDKYRSVVTEEFTVLYSGNIGLAQGLETVLEAAYRLKNKPIYFKIIGDGTQRLELEKMSREMKLNNIQFIDPQHREDLIHSIQSSSICLVPLVDSLLFRNAIPSKLFEYMACNKPVIVGISGEVESIIEESNGGICVNPQDSDALANTILDYYENDSITKKVGQSGGAYVRKFFIKEELLDSALKEIGDNL